jgi:hypothetical protein
VNIPRNSAIVAVVVPAGGTVTYDEERMRIDGVVVDYRSGHAVPDHRPRIKGLGAAPSVIYAGATARLYCTALDRDGDTLSYVWFAPGGVLQGQGAVVTWDAPSLTGSYTIHCLVADPAGGFDSAQVGVAVVDTPLSLPVISGILARPSKVDIGGTTTVSCSAADPGGEMLSYHWSAAQGTISGSDSLVQWTAPLSPGNYSIVCTADNGQGGTAKDSVVVPVREFSAAGTGALVLSMPFAGDANDVSGFGNNGWPTDVVPVADRFGTAAHAYGFNGATSAVRVMNSPSLCLDSAITVAFWIKPGLMPAREMFPISHGSWQNRWKVSITPDRKIRWTIKTTDGVTDLDSRTAVETGVYYFVAGIYDGSDMELYVNGEVEAFRAWSGLLLTPAIDLMIGQMLPEETNYNFPGVVDDIKIYSYALAYPRVQELYLVPTGVPGDEGPALPAVAALVGTYPNPFNPSASIVIQVPDNGPVTLRVFDVLGNEVATLLNGRPGPGQHTFRFDGSGCASGVYLCRLVAGSRTGVIKMILVR